MSESTEMAVNQIAALGARQLAGILEGVSEEEVSTALDGIPDPAGTFYRYSMSSSLLGSRRADYQGFRYELSANVVHFEEHFLYDDLHARESPRAVIHQIATHPQEPGILFVATDRGIFHSSDAGDRPAAEKVGRNGSCGGFTSTTTPPAARWRAATAGSNSDHTAASRAGCSSSISAPSGQPPPGSSASSAAWPLGWHRFRLCASSSACQMATPARSSVGRAAAPLPSRPPGGTSARGEGRARALI